jgi:multiple sugar transport system substrate-binding protein
MVPITGQVSARSTHATTTITFEMYSWSGQPGFEKVLSRFEQLHPNIKIKQEWLSYSNYWSKVETQAVAGQTPDVFDTDPGFMQEFALKGVVLPLDPYIKKDYSNLNAFYPSALAAARWSPAGLNAGTGPFIGFPWDYQAGIWVYNKTAFQKAGLKLPTSTWTWADVLADAQKLTKRNAAGKVTQWGIQVFGGLEEDELILLTWAAGGRYWTPDLKKIDLMNPGFKRAIQFDHDLIWKYKVAPQLTPSNQVDPFMAGTAAMLASGTWQLFPYQQIKNFQWDVAPLPQVSPTVPSVNWADSNNFSIGKNSKNPSAAWELIKFIAGPGEGQQMIARMKVEPPVVKAYAPLYYDFHPPAHINLILDSFKTDRAEPNFLGLGHLIDQFGKGSQAILLNPGPIEPGLMTMQDSMQSVLDQQWQALSNH